MKILSHIVTCLFLFSLTISAHAQEPVYINFDDLSAPCDFASALPLSDEYVDLGVEFYGGAAVLGGCSGYDVPGYSPPNFAAFDPNAQLANGEIAERLHFSFYGNSPRLVRLAVGGTPDTNVILSCTYNPWGIGGFVLDSVILDDSIQILEVQSEDPFHVGCVVLSDAPTGTWIIDDIELHFRLPAEAIPSLSPTGAVFFAFLVAVLGLIFVRRMNGPA